MLPYPAKDYCRFTKTKHGSDGNGSGESFKAKTWQIGNGAFG